MKILLISPHFYPEIFKCNDVAFELSKRGYDVTVLSDIPNYPIGHYFKGYGLFKKRIEHLHGVKVIRCAVVPRGNGSGTRLAFNYLSFVFSSCLWVVLLAIRGKFEHILVHETSPVTVGIPAVLMKLLRGGKLHFWVLDLWPESLQAAGGVNNKNVLSFFTKITSWIYRNSDTILISSRRFRESICNKGNFTDKLVYFPNWAEDVIMKESEYPLPPLPNGFIAMFAGNIGEAQDFEHILGAIKIIVNNQEQSTNEIHFVFVGDGRKRSWIEKYVKENHLEKCTHLVGRYPIEAMSAFFKRADVLFFALKDSLIFNLTCPAKLQAYMAAGKPVLAMLNGEGAEIINDAGCGWVVPAGDSKAMSEAIMKMSILTAEERERMGENGKCYCQQHFSFKHNMNILEKLFTEDVAL